MQFNNDNYHDVKKDRSVLFWFPRTDINSEEALQ